MVDTVEAKPTANVAQLQKSLAQVNESSLPGGKDTCPSCDKKGMAILVALYGVIPTQHFGHAQTEGLDWVSYADPGSMFDQDNYLGQRKLAESKSGTMLECSHYIVRRLRKGYLYVYYPDDQSWEAYAVQTDGRLLRMQLDMLHAMGKGDVACSRFQHEAGALLLTVDTKKHPVFWAAFSDAAWTRNVREKVVVPALANYMKRVTVASKEHLVAIGDEGTLKNAVMGFQERPLTETANREAYPRPPKTAAAGVYQTMASLNKDFNNDGFILPLEDDVGITTQLNFSRNLALIDIMGEGDGYTELDKNKMVTAGLLGNIKDIVGDDWSRVEKQLVPGQFDKYLEKYKRCEDARADYDSYSNDYIKWIQHLLTRKIHKLFDADVPQMGISLAKIVADVFEGSGLSKTEFNQVLLPQLVADVNDEKQLLWRGAAANDKALLALLTNVTIDKAIIEGRKKFAEATEQVNMLNELSEAKTHAAKLNQAQWSRLARLIASRARSLRDANPKAFRRTIRRIQSVTLTTENMGVLEVAMQGDASGYLQQLRNALAGGAKVKLTPKNQGQIAALSELMVATWPPGEPMPPGLNQLTKELGIGANELPPSTTTKIHESAPGKASMRALVGLNAGLAALQAFSLYASLKELGVDIGEARATGDANWARMAKETLEASAAFLGAASAGYEVQATLRQIASTGTKTANYFKLSLTASKLVTATSIIEGVLQIADGVELLNGGDTSAGASKVVAGTAGGASGITGYIAVRMIARAGIEEAAKKAAIGTAGEVAADIAAGSAVARGGAVVTTEAAPVAMWLTVISIGLWAVSLGFYQWSKYLTTTPLEKWAFRCFLGKRQKGKWGGPYDEIKDQFDALLHLFYTVKIEKPSAFGSSNNIEITVPVFGDGSELDIKVDAPVASGRTTVAQYSIKGTGLAPGAIPILKNLARVQKDTEIHSEVKREGEGLVVKVHVGAEGWMNTIKAATWDALVSGVPSPEVKYWPNRAAYDGFYVDGRTPEEVEESETKNKEKGHGEK
jgi:hypothetical protein